MLRGQLELKWKMRDLLSRFVYKEIHLSFFKFRNQVEIMVSFLMELKGHLDEIIIFFATLGQYKTFGGKIILF